MIKRGVNDGFNACVTSTFRRLNIAASWLYETTAVWGEKRRFADNVITEYSQPTYIRTGWWTASFFNAQRKSFESLGVLFLINFEDKATLLDNNNRFARLASLVFLPSNTPPDRRFVFVSQCQWLPSLWAGSPRRAMIDRHSVQHVARTGPPAEEHSSLTTTASSLMCVLSSVPTKIYSGPC